MATSFQENRLALAAHDRPFNLASATAPIYSRARFLAPSRLDGVTIRNSLVADGCEIEDGTEIDNSVIGLRCRIGRGAKIRDSIVFENDDYESADAAEGAAAAGLPLQGIGERTVIEGAIIDKNCRIGRSVRIANDLKVESSEETDEAVIRDGIMCVQKGAVLPDDWRM